MTRYKRLAHFSDIHVTLRPHEEPLSVLHPKRALGAINYYFFGRAFHFRGVEARIETLLADVDAQSVDHALCTGDITSLSHEKEFASCAALFGPRLNLPDRYTVIPGNHDRYTKAALDERRFERYFGRVSSPDHVYPFVKRLAPGVSLVAIDVARPTIWDSAGLCGSEQRAKLEAILTDRSLADDFVIFALHYGLLRRTGKPDRPSHRVADYREIIDLIDRDDTHVDMVVHGHLHRHFQVATKKRQRPIVNAGSATDLAIRCGYNVYTLDLERRNFATERRTWNQTAGAYEREPS